MWSDSTWEEAKLPISLISLVKAMGMEPECPTVVAAVAGMSYDKKKGKGHVPKCCAALPSQRARSPGSARAQRQAGRVA